MKKNYKNLVFITVVVAFVIFILILILPKYSKYLRLSEGKYINGTYVEIEYKCFGYVHIDKSVMGGVFPSYCLGVKYDKKCFNIEYGKETVMNGIPSIAKKTPVSCE